VLCGPVDDRKQGSQTQLVVCIILYVIGVSCPYAIRSLMPTRHWRQWQVALAPPSPHLIAPFVFTLSTPIQSIHVAGGAGAMPYLARGRARRRAPTGRGRSGWHPSSNPTCHCVVHIQGIAGSCSAGEAWEGKGARRGASVVAHLVLTDGVAFQFDPSRVWSQKGPWRPRPLVKAPCDPLWFSPVSFSIISPQQLIQPFCCLIFLLRHPL